MEGIVRFEEMVYTDEDDVFDGTVFLFVYL